MRILLFCSLITFTFLLAACVKELPPGTEKNFMRARIDGVLYECDLSVQGSRKHDTLGLVGFWQPVRGFNFVLMNYRGPGTYRAGNGDNNLFLLTKGFSADDTFQADRRQGNENEMIIHTDNNNLLKGTFRFRGISMNGFGKSITEGSFEIKLQ